MSDDRTRRVMRAATRADIAALHAFDRWPARHLWPMTASLIALALAAAAAWHSGAYRPVLLLVWPAEGYVMFLFLLAFHDASHGRFHPVPWLNELFGHVAGSLSLVPLSVYRYAHARHHAHLGTQRDPELWPFNRPGTPRAARVAAAALEITLGVVYTPLLFLRAVAVGGPSGSERRAIGAGYAVCGLSAAAGLAVVQFLGLWDFFVVVLLVPAAISGAIQTLNKYTQHLGLHGRSVLGLTRTVGEGPRYAEMVSSSMLNNDRHGTHHRYAKIPYYHLPAATPYALSNARETATVFRSVFGAAMDMLPALADPKVGPQWSDTAAARAVTE